MWKWLLIIVVLCLALTPTTALADDPTVTITVSKWVVGLPSGFTLTYINDYEVQIDWVKGLNAENTMIRAAIGRPPESITDGMEIYYGDGATATSWINMETLSELVYYRAWSETAEGIWSPLYAEDQIEGVNMLLWVLVFLALAFTIASVILKKGFLSFAGAGAWIVASVFCFGHAAETWDIYFSLGFLFIALTLASFFAPLAWRETTAVGGTTEEPDTLMEGLRGEMKYFNEMSDRYEFMNNSKRNKRKGFK